MVVFFVPYGIKLLDKYKNSVSFDLPITYFVQDFLFKQSTFDVNFLILENLDTNQFSSFSILALDYLTVGSRTKHIDNLIATRVKE